MKKVIIVRSVSFQLLDKLLPTIKNYFKKAEYSLLTHPHGATIAQATNQYTQVFTYNHSTSFSFWKASSPELKQRFDAVVLPVANLTSGGFCNVLLFSLKINTGSRYICNSVGELSAITTQEIVGKWLKTFLCKSLAIVITFVAAAPLAMLCSFALVACGMLKLFDRSK